MYHLVIVQALMKSWQYDVILSSMNLTIRSYTRPNNNNNDDEELGFVKPMHIFSIYAIVCIFSNNIVYMYIQILDSDRH